MADDEGDLGSGLDAPQGADGSGGTGAGDPSAGQSGSGGGAAGTHGDADVAKLNKRVEDLAKQLNRERSEKDKAHARLQKLQDDTLSKLADAASPKRDENAEALERRAALAKRYDAGELSGDELISLVENGMSVAEERAMRKATEEMKRRDEQINSLVSQIQELNPKYAAHREKVAELQESFKERGIDLSRDQALAVAEEIARASGPGQPGRPPLPGNGDGVVHGAGDDGVPAQTFAQMEALTGIKLGPEQRKALERKWAKAK